MKYCSECGNEIQEDERFCSNCGTSIVDDSKEEDSEEKYLAVMEVSDKNGGDTPTKNFNFKDFLTTILGYIITFFIVTFIEAFIVNLFNFGTTMRSIIGTITMIFIVMIGCAMGKSVHADITVGLFLAYDAFAYTHKNWGQGIAAILLLMAACGKWQDMKKTHEKQ